MIFVDTNYFLRFLVKDHTPHQKIALALFKEAAAGKIQLTTSIIVVFELYWVLSSFYKRDKTDVISILQRILDMRFIEIDSREILEATLIIFAKHNVDLEDAFNAVYARQHGITEFKTFDKKLNNLFISLTK